MTIRLAVHVGPHKTGSTSVQRALAANRERLAESGVWYPPSLANAQFPDQHADIAILLATSLIPSALEWLQQAGDEAGRRGCDTVFVSSENFRAPRIRHRLGILLRDHRRRTGAETRLLYVRRESAALARSTVMARLDGELGFFFREHYDLRTWAADFVHQQRQEERFFLRQGCRFLRLEATPPALLAAELLRLATDREFSFVETGRENVTKARLASPPAAMLAYGVRVMEKIVSGGGIVGRNAAQVVPLVGEPAATTAGYRDLLAAFGTAVEAAIKAGFADATRETIWHYRWRLLRRHLVEVNRLW